MDIKENIRRISWTPILLVVLALVSLAEWRATVRLEAVQYELLRSHYWIADQLSQGNQRLKEISQHSDSIEDNTDCLRMSHPSWCR